jgi:general secretion pathway protein L
MKTKELGTCFLFAKDLDAEGCLSMRFNAHGEEDAALKRRTLEEISVLQASTKTIVVLPSCSASLHTLSLPWLGERKAREAIPFALEEVIAQPVSEMHFAFDKNHYTEGKYLVVAIENELFSRWIGLLDELNIDFDMLTLDWFALKPGEVFIDDSRVLMATENFKGALSFGVAQMYLNSPTEIFQGFLFRDSFIHANSLQWTKVDDTFNSFVAKRLVSRPFMNLCQGDFKHNTHRETNIRWYQAGLFLLGLWLVTILGTNGLILNKLKNQDLYLQQKMAEIYRIFFPNTNMSDVVNPRLRIEQVLRDQASGKKGELWYLLGPLVKSFDDTEGVKVTEWWYQKNMMTLNLVAKDFSSLEKFEKNLEKMNIKVKQNSASNVEKGEVTAVLELEA